MKIHCYKTLVKRNLSEYDCASEHDVDDEISTIEQYKPKAEASWLYEWRRNRTMLNLSMCTQVININDDKGTHQSKTQQREAHTSINDDEDTTGTTIDNDLVSTNKTTTKDEIETQTIPHTLHPLCTAMPPSMHNTKVR